MITDEALLKNNTKKYIIIGAAIVIVIIVIIIILKSNNYNKLNIDLNNMCIDNTYDGGVKKLTKLENSEEYTISKTEAIEAGTYDIEISPNKGYAWQDNSRKPKTIKCTITPAASGLNVNKEKITLNKGEQQTITINTNKEGKITLETDEKIIKISQKEITKEKEKVEVSISQLEEGNTTLKITFTPNDKNYATEEKVIEVDTTNYKKIKIPTSSICNNIVYNGNTQKLVSKTDYEGYTLEGQLEGKDAGNYKIQAILKNGYIWNDGKKENKNITCTIKKESNYSIVLHKNNCKIGETAEFTIQSKKAYTNINDNGVKSISNNKNLSTVTKKTKCDCINYIGYNNNNPSICANCTYVGRYEVKCNASGEDNIKITMDNGEVLTAKININKGDTIFLGTKENKFDGIKCTVGTEINVAISTYIDGALNKNRLQNYSIKNTSYATVSNGSNSTNSTNIIIKCLQKGNTELVVTTKDGTTAKFPIIY